MWWAYIHGGLIFGGAYSRRFTVSYIYTTPIYRHLSFGVVQLFLQFFPLSIIFLALFCFISSRLENSSILKTCEFIVLPLC